VFIRPGTTQLQRMPCFAYCSATLRVMQWNVKKTKGSDGVCNPDRIANSF